MTGGADIVARSCAYAAIESLREEFRAEAACQIVHHSILPRGLADPWLLTIVDEPVGYAGVWNRYHPGRVMEFHTVAQVRPQADECFRALLRASGASTLEAQTNIPQMIERVRDSVPEPRTEKLLFEDAARTSLECEGAIVRPAADEDERAKGAWVLEVDGAPVGFGGILYHYNPPYGDVYMEVRQGERGRGYGSYLVQELMRICRERGSVPAARCDPDNVASRRTLERAGFSVCGEIVAGAVREDFLRSARAGSESSVAT